MIRNLLLISMLCLLAASCKSPEARRPVQSKSGRFIQESAERNKKLYQEEEAVIAKIMAADTSKQYYASESGFWYFYNVKDTIQGQRPAFGDEVTFTYEVTTLNGTNILSAEENGLQYYKVDQTNQELISGIRDGIKLMQVGEEVTFYFPSYKAYGYYGIENKLGTNIPVRCKVNLLSLNIQEN